MNVALFKVCSLCCAHKETFFLGQSFDCTSMSWILNLICSFQGAKCRKGDHEVVDHLAATRTLIAKRSCMCALLQRAVFSRHALKYILPLLFAVVTFLKERPPTLPHRLQCSTIGRPGLNHRVRYGNGCFPRAYRRSKN